MLNLFAATDHSLAGCDVTHDADHANEGKARASRDYADLKKVLEWFAMHNPLHMTDRRPQSISFGIVAGDPEKITCDNAEEVGCAIVQKMDTCSTKKQLHSFIVVHEQEGQD